MGSFWCRESLEWRLREKRRVNKALFVSVSHLTKENGTSWSLRFSVVYFDFFFFFIASNKIYMPVSPSNVSGLSLVSYVAQHSIVSVYFM